MTDLKKHTGGCHCGAVRYEVEADLTAPMLECNCSICSKTGARLVFLPEQQFTLLSGRDQLTDYMFAKKHIHHQFCKICGVRSFAHGANPDGGEMYAINVRCIDDVDLDGMTIQKFDGKSA